MHFARPSELSSPIDKKFAAHCMYQCTVYFNYKILVNFEFADFNFPNSPIGCTVMEQMTSK